MPGDDKGHGPTKTVQFTIDGRTFAVDDPKQTAAALLRLAGLDPTQYDLREVRKGNAGPKRYDDADEVHVHEGDTFVTVRQRAEVA